MSDNFRELVRDTFLYLKDPLCPRQSILTSAENHIFFQKDKTTVVQKQETNFFQQRLPSKEKAAVPPMMAETINPSPKPVQPILTDNAVDSTHFSIKKTLQRITPNLKLIDRIPDDNQAKRTASGWKEKIPDVEVVLIACDSSADTLEFLKGLAKAIDKHLAKAKILMAERLEKEKCWDLFLNKNSFRLIIASDEMQKLPELMRFYKSAPAQFFLDETPLFILSSPSVYKSLEHRALLWKTLCQMLK